MTFDETLYARDDEMDEFGDSGAYGDSLEEDYEEEEEEEEAEVPGMIEPQPRRFRLRLRQDPLAGETRQSRRANQRRKSRQPRNRPRKNRPEKSPRRSRPKRRSRYASRQEKGGETTGPQAKRRSQPARAGAGVSF